MVGQKTSKKINTILELVKLTRPIHWLKNFALFAAIVFDGKLLDETLYANLALAFVSFSLATSATYSFNDVLDRKRDRLHPHKKERPVAKGVVSVNMALLIAFVFATLALTIASNLNPLFFYLISLYLIIQVIYSLWIKNLAILDILFIATGFIIRVFAGAVIVDAHLSVWFLLCVVSVALFLASGKRRAELNIIDIAPGTRKSLSKYPKELLNSYVTMFGSASWMSWALFTFFESPKVPTDLWLILAEISRTTTVDKILMATIPVAIFGIMRYESLIFRGKTESPERLFLKDTALVASISIWSLMVYMVLYGIHL